MNVKHDALWAQCLQLIKENVTEQQYNTWFKPIVFESFKSQTKTVLVKVPSTFVYEYLEENYVDLLGKVLTRVFGAGVRLNYRVVVVKQPAAATVLEGDEESHSDAPVKTRNINQAPTPLDAAPLEDIDSQLDPRKTFKNFIEGQSNKLPRSIGLSIAEHPNTTQFNPMFIYGPSGCGKTHLINAI